MVGLIWEEELVEHHIGIGVLVRRYLVLMVMMIMQKEIGQIIVLMECGQTKLQQILILIVLMDGQNSQMVLVVVQIVIEALVILVRMLVQDR